MKIRYWFWGGFLMVLMVGLMLVLFAFIRGGGQWAARQVEETEILPQTWKPVFQLTLAGGDSRYLEPEAVSGIRRQSEFWLQHRQGRVDRAMARELDLGIDPIFDQAIARIPAFADWYYSLGGEYMRLWQAAFGDLPAYLEQRLEEQVFGPAGTARALDDVLPRLDSRLAGQLQATVADFHTLLRQLVDPLSADPGDEAVRVAGRWNPGAVIARGIEPYIAWNDADLGRQGVAGGAGAAASAVVFKKLGASTVAKTGSVLAGKQSAGMLAALAAKLGLKTAAKSGVLAGSGAGALGGAGLCAGSVVGAPLAPGCALLGGLLTGAATWVAVDKTVLEADELLHREDLERQMREVLLAQRDELKKKLVRHYGGLSNQAFDAMASGLNGNLERN